MKYPKMGLPLISLWLLALLTFTIPGRHAPEGLSSLDTVALAKVAARASVLALGGWTIVSCWDHPRRRLVAGALLPLLLYVAWAGLSVTWSPTKAFSLGQAASLAVQVLLALILGLAASDYKDMLRTIFHLNGMLLAISAILLGMYLVAPQIVGFERGNIMEGMTGAFHPTSAGAVASLGILLLLLTWLIWSPRWSTWLLLPGLLIHSNVLLLAASRMAIVMLALVLAIVLPVLMHRGWLASLVLGGSVLGALYLSIDPGLTLAESAVGSAGGYMRREQSAESLMSFTGRTELWGAIWGEFCKRPLLGAGYFTTSHEDIYVWQRDGSNYTAHNLLLQVAASTGIVGLGLFLWGLARVFRRTAHDLAASESGRRIGVVLLFVGGWYLGWAQLSESFMGALQPESLVFFYCMGIALAGLRTPAEAEATPAPVSSCRAEPWRAAP